MTPSVDQLIADIPHLASYGKAVRELESVLCDPRSTLMEVAESIEKDPALTACLLRLGNSSFFGFPRRLETISETISLIGVRQVYDLVLAATVVEMFDGISPDVVSMESFWRHCFGCGVAGRLLALARQAPKPDKYFVAGLLQDIGWLVLYSQATQAVQEIFQLYRSLEVPLREAETAVLGYDHAAIGGGLLQAWNYPASMVNAVRYHHEPMAAGLFQLESSLLHLSDYLVGALRLGSTGERFVVPLEMKAWERLNLALPVLDSVLQSIDEQVAAVEAAFLQPRGGAPNE